MMTRAPYGRNPCGAEASHRALDASLGRKKLWNDDVSVTRGSYTGEREEKGNLAGRGRCRRGRSGHVTGRGIPERKCFLTIDT